MSLQTQRTALNDIKVTVQENNQDIAKQHREVVSKVALTCETFAQEKRDLEESLRKVKLQLQIDMYKTWYSGLMASVLASGLTRS